MNITDAEMLQMASAFDLVPFEPNGTRPKGRVREVRIERRRIGPEAWAIIFDGGVLNREGEWEHEPFPSSRDDDFLARCRWPSAREAIEFARHHLEQYPDGYKPEQS